MALVVSKAKVVIIVIVPHMISFTEQVIFCHDLNPVESLVLMVNGRMVPLWFHGNMEDFSYGMQHVWTPMRLLIAELHHRRQGQ